jgi:hypothetical protein
LTVTPSLLLGLNGQAQNMSYRQITLIHLPGIPPQSGAFSYGISGVDPGTHRYYLADRTGNGIDVVDTKTNRWVQNLPTGAAAHSVAVTQRTI